MGLLYRAPMNFPVSMPPKSMVPGEVRNEVGIQMQYIPEDNAGLPKFRPKARLWIKPSI
jgi:hypothetical protein